MFYDISLSYYNYVIQPEFRKSVKATYILAITYMILDQSELLLALMAQVCRMTQG